MPDIYAAIKPLEFASVIPMKIRGVAVQRTHYEILEIPANATPAEIKQAYRRQAMKWHPDRQPRHRQQAEERFKEIAHAYKGLSDSSARARYDSDLRRQRQGAEAASGDVPARMFIDQILDLAAELTCRRVTSFMGFFGMNYLSWYGNRA